MGSVPGGLSKTWKRLVIAAVNAILLKFNHEDGDEDGGVGGKEI